MAGKTPAQVALFQTQFTPLARNVGLLTQGLEPARGPGLVAATSIAGSVSTSPRQLMGYSGEFAPISQPGSAGTLATERRAAAATAAGTPLAAPRTPSERQAAKEQAELRGDRRARIAQIFLRLRRIASRGELEGLAGADADVLRRVADKFQAWSNARFKGRSPDALEKASTEFTAALMAWMERYYG
jgi:hypothetical protein